MGPLIRPRDARSSRLGEKTVERQPIVVSFSKLLVSDPNREVWETPKIWAGRSGDLEMPLFGSRG